MTRCLQLHPGICGSAVLIDPVSLLVLHPKLLGNFVYNKASKEDKRHKASGPSSGAPSRTYPLCLLQVLGFTVWVS